MTSTVAHVLVAAVERPDSGLFDFLHTMKGPEFLQLFIVWFVIVRVGVAILRARLGNLAWITAGGLVLFEGLGAFRYYVGSAQGMHMWGNLGAVMVIGFVLICMTADSFSSSRTSNDSATGGCGGGGRCGGGGGCGGCGGD
jgi:hypothetical protein